MTKKILKLKEKYNEVLKTTSKMREAASNRLQEELNKVFDKDEELKKSIQDAELSEEYGSDDSGIYTWTRYNIPDKYKEFTHYLSNYIGDHGFHLEIKHDAIVNYQGECIVINDEGDIFLDYDVIIGKHSYETVAERNELIEEWMNKEGYFPAVLYQGYYGDLHLVNTQTKEVSNGN